MNAKPPDDRVPRTVSLADEEGVMRILVDTVFGLWATVNNLTRLQPSRRERYRVTVFGDTRGVAPGYKATLSWTKLTFYSEGEYLFDTNESSDSFFYAWSELAWAPADWCRFGLVGQRTKVYETDRDIQRGFLIGFSSERVDFTAYGFNLDERSPTVVLALGVSF